MCIWKNITWLFCSIQTKNEKNSLASKTLADFSSLYRSSLKDGVIDQDEYNKLFNTSTDFKNKKSKNYFTYFLELIFFSYNNLIINSININKFNILFLYKILVFIILLSVNLIF